MTEDQEISRKRVRYILNHLPSLVPVETPPSVRRAAWYKEAKLEGELFVWAFEGQMIEKASGKLGSVEENFKQFEHRGIFKTRPTLIIPSSGNFLKDAGAVAKGYDVESIRGVLPRGISEGKLKQIEAVGVIPMVTPEGMTTIQYAYQLESQGSNRKVMNQYIEDATIVGQGEIIRHILAEAVRLRWFDRNILAAAITGTGGTLTAMRRYLPEFFNSVKILGVASHNKKEKVPASRSPEDFEELRDINGECGFMFRDEWKNVLDFPLVTDVMRDQAFAMNGELFGCHYSVGPTGALLTAGLYRFLEQCHKEGTLKDVLKGIRNAVLIWMDSYYAYDDPAYRKFLTGAVR